jgi:protein tyrosine/serine phosphatase
MKQRTPVSGGASQRHLAWDGCYNVRDLGGLSTTSGQLTASGVFVRADDVSKLSDEGWDALVAYGVRTIIDLRHPVELRETGVRARIEHRARTRGLRYENVPFLDDSNTAAMAELERAPSTADLYRRMLRKFSRNVARIFHALAAVDETTTVVQCLAGRDRTGLVAAFLLELSGVPRTAAAADYALSAERLRPFFDPWLESVEDEELRKRLSSENDTPADNLLSALSTLDEEFGGVAPYLSASGVAAPALDRLRRRLTGGG